MSELFMSPYKAVHWTSELSAWESGKLVYPHMLQIDPVAGCNHSCPFCTYRAQSDEEANANFNESDIIAYDDIIHILDDTVEMGVKAAEITGGGEPSLHPRFTDILQACHERDIEIGLITNGTGKAFRDKRLDDTIAQLRTAEWVRFSINGGLTSYRDVHRGRENDLDVALNSARAMCEAKSIDTKVGISFILWKENYQDIEQMVEIAEEIGCDYIRFAPALFGETTMLGKRQNNFPTYSDEVRDAIETTLLKCKNEYSILITDMFSDRLNQRESKDFYDANDLCYVSEVMACIGADMALYPCCVKKYTQSGYIGSLKPNGLKALWESDERQAYYKKMNLLSMCKTCHFKPKNDLIKYLLTPNPPHINFL